MQLVGEHPQARVIPLGDLAESGATRSALLPGALRFHPQATATSGLFVCALAKPAEL